MFANQEIDISTIPKAEIVSLKPISRSYLKILFINNILKYIILFGLIISGNNFLEKEWISNVFWYVIILLVVLFILQSIITVLGFKKRGYALRTHDIIYAKGLLSHKKTIVPFIRIQHTETKQSFIAKLFNLASLNVYTAGESGGDLSINGLTRTEAENINQLLTTKIK
ncbi:PH domain-containing protein [Lacinutrix sp.]|uniref:PH domain-containing protein n=1 Tax=Lacinutrix sp. TaxID=1937692 RepID=UPI0025C37B2E|nr:PH domain-containing protein [Lacinutrix sp.]